MRQMYKKWKKMSLRTKGSSLSKEKKGQVPAKIMIKSQIMNLSRALRKSKSLKSNVSAKYFDS